MVEKFGTADYVPNGVSIDEYANALFSAVKKRGGCGGNGSKSHNFKEKKNMNKRRNEKLIREQEKEEAMARQ